MSRLFSDGVELVNALELVDWDSEDVQLLVCGACGHTHCKPGDWASIRKSNSLILLLPATQYVWGERREREEYGPPYYLKERGAAYLDLSTYENLRSKHPSFPPAEQIRHLNMREAALLFQWDAPARVLGEPPEVSARRDVILASSEGDVVECLKQLEALVQSQYKDESHATLRPVSDGEQVVSFYLDASELIEWKALVFDNSARRLLVDSRYVITGGAG